MLYCERIINQLFSSNCYILLDKLSLHCIVIDPASEKSLNEIDFILQHNAILDYVILTHEHTDHNWGVNSLLDKFPTSKVICSEGCKQQLPKVKQAYFALTMDDPNYEYHVKKVDCTIEELNYQLSWCNYKINFVLTPGHSVGSMCISIDNMLFTGDTVMNVKKMYIDKNTGDKALWEQNRKLIVDNFSLDTIVYPGHGADFYLRDYKNV